MSLFDVNPTVVMGIRSLSDRKLESKIVSLLFALSKTSYNRNFSYFENNSSSKVKKASQTSFFLYSFCHQ